MATNNARLYAPIEKTEELADGTLKVWGYASAPTEDSDGEIITADAMKAALPDYLKFGAVREMHDGKKAAGTAIEAEVQGDGRTWFGAHVVDAEAVKKVQNKVYKGFSIGGRITARDDVVKSTITGLKLVEVSLVDRPANPDAVFTMFKAETELTAVETIAKMVNDGQVTPEQIVEIVKASQRRSDIVEKGMGNVAQLASYLKYISWMVCDQMNEAAREGDGSTVPAALKDWLAQGVAILCDMTDEETAELLASLPQEEVVAEDMDDMVMAAATDDLAKAGARNSKSDAAMIQAMHDNAVSLGATCDAGKHAAPEVTKVKAEPLGDVIAKAITAATEDLQKRLAAIEAQPATPKAILKAVDKATDSIIAEPAPDVVRKADGSVDPTLTAMKGALSRPIKLFG